jgi:hypothetical protein
MAIEGNHTILRVPDTHRSGDTFSDNLEITTRPHRSRS